jgi:RNA polymerase sigma-70 factor (ECF subfamily)
MTDGIRDQRPLTDMESVARAGAVAREQPQTDTGQRRAVRAVPPAFGEVYEAYFDFVWRSARRLGMADSALEDAVQDVFIVVHRRLPEFEGRSSIKTWLFGIVLRTVRGYRRTGRRKPTSPLVPENVADTAPYAHPEAAAGAAEAVRLLYQLLDGLDDEKREVFVQAELEQMTAQEIAETMGTNVNTVYSRLRAARKAFNQAVIRLRARDSWRYR